MSTRTSTLVARALVVLWLAPVWLLLWGEFGPPYLVAGVVVAVVAVWASRLPALPLHTRIRPQKVPSAVLRFGVDLVRSSWQVAASTVRRGPGNRSSVLALRVPPEASDTCVFLVSSRISLEPGTIVVDVDRRHDRIFVYQLDTQDHAHAERARADAQRLVDEVVEMFPSRRGDAP